MPVKMASTDVLRKKTELSMFEEHLLGQCVYRFVRELEW